MNQNKQTINFRDKIRFSSKSFTNNLFTLRRVKSKNFELNLHLYLNQYQNPVFKKKKETAIIANDS